MNVTRGRRKRVTAQRHQDYLDFNRINPIGADDGQAPKLLDNQSRQNDQSFTTLATYGNSIVTQSSTYLSITCGRGYAHGEVGIAYIDIESPSVKLIQLSDDPWYIALLMKIHIIDPCQIIVPHTIYDAKPETTDGKLVKFIREEFPKLVLAKVPRRHFNETDGLELIKKYCSDKYNYVKEEITTKYYALSAASGLWKYLQFVHNIFFKENSLKLDFATKFAHMQIDIDTSYKLELLTQNNPNTVKSNFPSLYNVLNYCVTSLGKRTLRARILEPMCDIPSINDIHDCIAELNQPEYHELSDNLMSVLRNFNNIERLHKLAMVVPQDDSIRAAEILINQALHLKKCLKLVPALECRLATLSSKKFREIQTHLMDQRYVSMLNHIETAINNNLHEYQKDSSSQLQTRIFCIQNGVNDLIDILRKSYVDLTGQIEVLVAEMSSKYGQAFKTNYSVQRGFHIILLIAHHAITHEFPDEVEVIEIKRNTCFLTTQEVNKLNIRIQNVIEEITIQSNVVIASMLNGIMKEIDAIYDLSGYIATLDIILSFATVSASDTFVRPTFGDEMRIVDAVHPLLEQNIHRTVATPNNIISTPDYNFFIITGPNMSGKTVYIKMIAILQIMAQVGCYVPAKSAQFRITDRIFSRMGFNDSIEKNLSTFMMEMNNIEHILKNVTPNSLVIIDELCRSTNPKEGAQLAWNICEYLATIRGICNDGKYFVNCETQMTGNSNDNETIENGAAVATLERASTTTRSSSWKNTKLNVITAPFIFLTTHFHSLTKLANHFFNVVNLSFSAEQITTNENEQSLLYNHRIQEGVTTTTSYGLAVAKTVRFSADIIAQAMELNQNFVTGEISQNTDRNYSRRKLSNIGRQIMQSNLSSSQLMTINDAASVVSAVINATTRRRRRLAAASLCSMGENVMTSSTAYEDHLKIDRVLYNVYGDIMSIVRTTEIDWTARYHDECNNGIYLDDYQHEAIKNFLANFVEDQHDGLIEALGNLSLSQEMPESPAEKECVVNYQVQQNKKSPIIEKIENVECDLDQSSVISIQCIVPVHSTEVKCNTPVQERSILHVSGNGKFSTADNRQLKEPTKESEITSSPQTPSRSCLNSSFRPLNASRTFTMDKSRYFDVSQSSFESISFQTDIDDLYYSSSASSSGSSRWPNSQNDSFFIQPTQDFHMNNFQMDMSFSQSQRSNASSNIFNRSQSHTDLFRIPCKRDNISTSIHFSQQDSLNDFECQSSKLPILSFKSRSSQQSRPDLSKIKKSTMTSRSHTNLAAGSNSGTTSSNSKYGKFASDDLAHSSSDSIRSDSIETKRKVPIIRKTKLKPSSVFGDTSSIFATPMAEIKAPKPKTKPPTQNQFPDRKTDTNYMATMQRLQKIQARMFASGTKANATTTPQRNPASQVPSHQLQLQQQSESNEDSPLPPPKGFE